MKSTGLRIEEAAKAHGWEVNYPGSRVWTLTRAPHEYITITFTASWAVSNAYIGKAGGFSIDSGEPGKADRIIEALSTPDLRDPHIRAVTIECPPVNTGVTQVITLARCCESPAPRTGAPRQSTARMCVAIHCMNCGTDYGRITWSAS